MTPEAQDASIGKLVREISECNRTVVALENEIDRAGEALKNTGSLLKQARRDPSEKALYESSIDSEITNLPNQETLRNLLHELREQRKLQNDLRTQASKLHISL